MSLLSIYFSFSCLYIYVSYSLSLLAIYLSPSLFPFILYTLFLSSQSQAHSLSHLSYTLSLPYHPYSTLYYPVHPPLGDFANRLPDYHKIDVMCFIIQKIPQEQKSVPSYHHYYTYSYTSMYHLHVAIIHVGNLKIYSCRRC